MEDIRNYKVLICVTGSVAAIKVPELIQVLRTKAMAKGWELTVRVCVTANSLHFCPLQDLTPLCDVYQDEDEWKLWQGRGDPVLHIDLGKWADLVLLAPLDANTLAKIACGLCDNLVLCVCRAFDLTKPLLYCPAMNTRMWTHPVTSSHIDLLTKWGYKQLPPVAKTLMCGDIGVGAMMEPHDIANSVIDTLAANITR